MLSLLLRSWVICVAVFVLISWFVVVLSWVISPSSNESEALHLHDLYHAAHNWLRYMRLNRWKSIACRGLHQLRTAAIGLCRGCWWGRRLSSLSCQRNLLRGTSKIWTSFSSLIALSATSTLRLRKTPSTPRNFHRPQNIVDSNRIKVVLMLFFL